MPSQSSTRSSSRQPSPDDEDYDPSFRRLHRLQRASRPGGQLSEADRSRSASPGLFSRIGLVAPTLEVHLMEDQLFLHPSLDTEEPTMDPTCRGTVTLTLPKARTLHHLAVRVIGRQDIGWSDHHPHESNVTILDREVTLHDSTGSASDDAHLRLEKGCHEFEFVVIIPSSTPTYERCCWGRTRFRVVAKAKGLGSLGTDVSSVEKELFLVANPGGAGRSMPPPSVHFRIEGTLDTVSPFGIEIQATHIMVSGLMLLRFNFLPLSGRPIVIASVALTLRQYFTLQSPSDPNHMAHPDPDIFHLAHLDGAHPPNDGQLQSEFKPHKIEPGSSSLNPLWMSGNGASQLSLRHLVRLPKDTILRPSTLPGSKAWISLRHVIEVEIVYHVPTEAGELGEAQRVAVQKPLEIFSCGAHLPSLTLPEYSFDDPVPRLSDQPPHCLCGLKLPLLIERHGKTLLLEEAPPRTPKFGDDSARREGLVEHVG